MTISDSQLDRARNPTHGLHTRAYIETDAVLNVEVLSVYADDGMGLQPWFTVPLADLDKMDSFHRFACDMEKGRGKE